MDRGYFTEPSKLLFIADNPEEKETAMQDFDMAGLHINYVGSSQYLGTYLGPGRI